MLTNFCCWAEKRKGEISADDSIVDKHGERHKLDERMGKFREKMSFLTKVKDSYQQAIATKDSASAGHAGKVAPKRRSSILGAIA